MPNRSYCLPCKQGMNRDHYENNKEMYTNKARAQKHRMTKIIQEAKAVPCKDCGIRYPPYVMDFDHLGDKEINVSSLSVMGSPGRILKEIVKCEVVCSNCHRQRTYSRIVQLAGQRSLKP